MAARRRPRAPPRARVGGLPGGRADRRTRWRFASPDLARTGLPAGGSRPIRSAEPFRRALTPVRYLSQRLASRPDLFGLAGAYLVAGGFGDDARLELRPRSELEVRAQVDGGCCGRWCGGPLQTQSKARSSWSGATPGSTGPAGACGWPRASRARRATGSWRCARHPRSSWRCRALEMVRRSPRSRPRSWDAGEPGRPRAELVRRLSEATCFCRSARRSLSPVASRDRAGAGGARFAPRRRPLRAADPPRGGAGRRTRHGSHAR